MYDIGFVVFQPMTTLCDFFQTVYGYTSEIVFFDAENAKTIVFYVNDL